MLDLNIIEPILKDMQTYLFGENGVLTDGNMSVSDLNGMMGFLAKVKDATDTEYDYLDQIDEAYKKKYGESLKTNTGSSTTNSISGASEQEINILAAYMDSVRQDTFNLRTMVQRMIDEGVNVHMKENPIAQAQLQQLGLIATNTLRNADLVNDIKIMFNDIIQGNQKIHIA